MAFAEVFSLFLAISLLALYSNSENVEEEQRVYDFTRCHGAGCPYTASWLATSNLFSKSHWWMESTKMEAASFNIFDKAKFKFQLGDPDAYYVHHLSRFEHLVHKKSGFDDAQRRTLILSETAMAGECGNLTINPSNDFLALIPFYGGLPPNVTKDLTVQSIGQGNSLVNASVKVLQCMATLCSTLKYFGHAVIGTTRPEDLHLVKKILSEMGPAVQQRTHIVSFNMPKPAHLPFHVLAWGQFFVQAHNCPPPDASEAYIEEFKSKGFLSAKILSGKDQAYVDRYHICTVNVFKNHHGIPFNATYHPPAVPVSSSYPSHLIGHTKVEMSSETTASAHLASIPLHASKDPILFVYYTECDQVVRFDSLVTRDMVVAASNDTTFFVGRRREKVAESSEFDYMTGLNIYRTCGARGFSLLWPKDKFVQIES